MSDIGLFVCKKEEQGQDKSTNLLRNLYMLLKERLRKPKFEEMIERIELNGDVGLCILRLPYTLKEIGLKSEKLAMYGSMLRNRYEGITCIVPRKMEGMSLFEGCVSDAFTGRTLFKSLLVQIIDEIYVKKNIEASALDISIIHGESYGELHTVLHQLSPFVKFLTIITDYKEQVEEEVSKFYYDTGLAVRVTNEYRSGMKNADLIINFADSKEFVFNTRINPRAIIINYGNINYNKFLSDNIIVNGIDVGMPQGICSKLDKEIFEYYSRVELAEAILAHKASISNKMFEGIQDFSLSDTLSREFKKSGFSITGFIGRRNVFKAGDIKLYGT